MQDDQPWDRIQVVNVQPGDVILVTLKETPSFMKQAEHCKERFDESLPNNPVIIMTNEVGVAVLRTEEAHQEVVTEKLKGNAV